jgi:hypothetical protein
MASVPAAILSNARLFCDILSSTLQREEHELVEIARAAAFTGGRPEWFLTSVAHAPELAICYLVRKEARRQGVPIESEHKYVDLCLLHDGVHTASLEVKGPWEIRRSDVIRLQNDVQKVLGQSISAIPAAERYNGWILICEDEIQQRDVEQFVRTTIEGIAALGQCVVSDPIPINRNGGAVQSHDGYRFESIQVVVFNAVKIAVQ